MEEIQVPPKLTVTEQRQEEQPLKTTTEIEEQTTPQVTADASSTQPKVQEQVSDIHLAVSLGVFAVNRKLKRSAIFRRVHSLRLLLIFCVRINTDQRKRHAILWKQTQLSILADFDH